MAQANAAIRDGFHHVAMRVANFDAVVNFYTQALGLKEYIRWGEGKGRAIMLDAGHGNFVEVFADGTPDAKPEGALLHLAFRTYNCEEALAAAVAGGAQVTIAPTNVTIASQPHPTPVRIAFCRGLAGEIIEFFQQC